MQPASQVGILIWRSVLRSSRSSEYIKPIKPPRHPVPYKMSSNYRLHSSLSPLFANHSMKMSHTHTPGSCSCSHSTSRSSYQGCVSGWSFSKAVWRWQRLQIPSVICMSLQCLCRKDPTQQHWRHQHLLLGYKPMVSLISVAPGSQAACLLFPSGKGSLVLTGQGFRRASVSLRALLLSQSALSAQRLCLVGF